MVYLLANYDSWFFNERGNLMSNIAVIEKDIYALQDRFNSVLSDHNISFEREAGFAMQVLESNDYALKIALGNRQSVINAVTNIASIGISLNPAKKQAYLVPRKGGIYLEISYMGLIDLAVQDGAAKWAKAELVYSGDSFMLNGAGNAPTHTHNPFSKDRGEIVGAYCVAKLPDGDYLTECMSLDEINSIRDRSESWKNGQKGPWKTDFGEMARKTVVKRASKYWSGTGERLQQAIHHLNTDGEEGLAVKEDGNRHMPAEPDGYESFEAEWLPKLRDAAMQGMKALQEMFVGIPANKSKGALWAKHKDSLKKAAEQVIEAEAT
jgi:recombination protein RecT